MSKINNIHITNFKAIKDLQMNFEGSTAIITGGNDKGKTSFLRGIPDRIRGIRPSIIVNDKEKAGKGTMTLTTGERFEWEFDNEGKDKLAFITKEGYKTKVTKEIANKFFPPIFDIDKFLEAQPKDQKLMFQKLIGLDFTAIDFEYKVAYDSRTEVNKDVERAKAKLTAYTTEPAKVEAISTDDLLKQKDLIRAKLNIAYKLNKAKNDKMREDWQVQCEDLRRNISEFNHLQNNRHEKYKRGEEAQRELTAIGYDGNEVGSFLLKLHKKIESQKEYVAPAEPAYITEMPDDSELKAIDDQIANATKTNGQAQEYRTWNILKGDLAVLIDAAKTADEAVKAIQFKKETMLKAAKLPAGIELTDDGIKVDGFELNKNQLSSSMLYKTALRLGNLALGEVKTQYFDASYLDKNSLAEIEKWAEENSLQLLIERPDFEGGEISYQLIESK